MTKVPSKFEHFLILTKLYESKVVKMPIKMTTIGVASKDNFVKVMTFPFYGSAEGPREIFKNSLRIA